MSESTKSDDVTQLRTEIESLRAQCAEVDSLKMQLANLTSLLEIKASGNSTIKGIPRGGETKTDRRGLLKVAGAATIGAVGVGLLNAVPAAATTSGFFGIYRGLCTNNQDPMHLGRIMALVPDVLGSSPSGWALPSFPVGSTRVPSDEPEEPVWIAFEGGDTHFPVWLGVFVDHPPTAAS